MFSTQGCPEGRLLTSHLDVRSPGRAAGLRAQRCRWGALAPVYRKVWAGCEGRGVRMIVDMGLMPGEYLPSEGSAKRA